jgi:HSP20 family protein
MNHSNKIKNVRSIPSSPTFKDIAKHIDREEFLFPFDTLFDQIFSSNFPEVAKELGVNVFEKQSYPKVDIIDYVDRTEIKAEIPGIARENVNVEVKDDILIISGNKVEVEDNKVGLVRVIRKELKHSNFKRSFTLSDIIDKQNIDAKFENGILTIRLLKLKPEKPEVKKIHIK